MDLEARTRQRLAETSQRVTTGRLRLVRAIAHIGRPATIVELRASDPSIPLSSAYRNLQVLEDAGLVHRVITDDAPRWELAEDFTGHHHHLICDRCGSVTDVPLPELERAVHDALTSARVEHGFVTHAHRVDLIGWCATCQRQA
ncbi:MAG: Fur family transcriptional regulator [Acidimicrobiia bacterium]